MNAFILKIRDTIENLIEIPNSAQLRNAMSKSNEEKVAVWEQLKVSSKIMKATNLRFTKRRFHKNNEWNIL